VSEEGDEVEREPPGPRIAFLRQVRERERRRDERDAERVDETRKRTSRRLERRCEAVEEVRKEDQDRDVDPLERLRRQALGLLGQEPAEDDHEGERHEGEGGPEGRFGALTPPLPHTDDRRRREQDEVENADELDRLPHVSSRRAPDYRRYRNATAAA
jgi:hypothetical protein